MDRVQASLREGFKVMGIEVENPLTTENYGTLCDFVYLADEFGVHFTNHRFHFDKGWRRLRPNRSMLSSANIQEESATFYDDIFGIIKGDDIGEWDGWNLKEDSLKALGILKPLVRTPRKLATLASVNYLLGENGSSLKDIAKKSGLDVREVRAAKRVLCKYGFNN